MRQLTTGELLYALARNHESVIEGRLCGESVYGEAHEAILEQQAEIERLTRDNAGLLGQVKYWQRTYGAAQAELVELRDKAARAAGGDDE